MSIPLLLDIALQRLPTLAIALIVAVLGVRWVLLGQRRGWVLVVSAGLYLLGMVSGVAFLGAWFFGLESQALAMGAVSLFDGVFRALAWAALFAAVFMPAGTERDLDEALG